MKLCLSKTHPLNSIHYEIVIFHFFKREHSLWIFPVTSWVCVRLHKRKNEDKEPN